MIRICFFSFFTFTMPILRWIREQIPNQFDIIKNYFNYGELRDNKGRHPRRDRLFFYGSRLVTRQIKRGDEDYVLAPVKVICIMNYEDEHPNCVMVKAKG